MESRTEKKLLVVHGGPGQKAPLSVQCVVSTSWTLNIDSMANNASMVYKSCLYLLVYISHLST